MTENFSLLINKFPDDANCYWLAKAWVKKPYREEFIILYKKK